MSAHRVAATAICLAIAFAAFGARAAELPRVVVLPAQGAPLDEADRQALDALLRAAVTADPGRVLVDVQGTTRFIENAAALGMMCAGDDVDCWAKAGVTGGAALLLLPIVVIDDTGARRLEVSLVDAARGDVVRGPTLDLPRPGGAIEAERLDEALKVVLAPRPTTGGLRVFARVAGARVVVDGQDRGTTPLVAPLVADEGRHTVELLAEGMIAEPVVVQVAPGMDADVEIDVRPAPPPAPPPLPPPAVDPRLAGGVSILASGGLLAVAAGAGIAASETAFCCTKADAGARNMWRGATATLLAVGAVSTAVALAGGGAVAWSMLGADDAP